MKKFNKGYTTGVFDLFHVGHLNVLRNSKIYCEELIVGISTDELVKERKNKTPFIPYEERREIVEHCLFVDATVPQADMDKFTVVKNLGCDVVFVGDDWKNHPTWIEYEQQFSSIGVTVVYLPYTKHTSSSKLQTTLDKFNHA